MSGTPAKKSEQLLSEVVHAFQRGKNPFERVDHFTIARYLRDADRELALDQADLDALSAKGIAYAMKHDERAIGIFDRLIGLYPNNSTVHYNSSLLFAHFGLIDRAINHGIHAASLETSIETSRNLASILPFAGRFDEAIGWLERWAKMAPSADLANHRELLHRFKDVAATFPDADTTAIADAFELAAQVVRERGHDFVLFNPRISGDDENEWLACTVSVDAPIRSILDIKREYRRRASRRDIISRLAGSALIVFEPSQATVAA